MLELEWWLETFLQNEVPGGGGGKMKIIIPASLRLMQGLIKMPDDINNVTSVFYRKSNILVVQLIMM